MLTFSPSKGALAQLFAHPRWDRLQRPRVRRLLSAAQLALALALGWVPLAIALAVPRSDGGLWLVPGAALALLLIVVVATGLLNASVGGLTEIPPADLDELQLRLRDAAMGRAYFVLGCAILCFLGVVVLAGLGEVSWPLVAAAGWLLYVAWLSGPTHVLAWTLPAAGDADA